MSEKTLLLNFRIPIRSIVIGFLLIVLFNFLFLGGTSLHNKYLFVDKSALSEFILRHFNLALENVIAAWYSSMLLLLIAIVAGICYIADRQHFTNVREKFLSYGWLVLSCIFAVLSFDEIGSFHEKINEIGLTNSSDVADGTSFSLLHVLIAIVGLFMVVFFWVKFKRSIWSLLFAIAGAGLFLSHPLQEAYEWHLMNTSGNPSEWHRPNIFVLLEEGSEIFGSLCFLISFTAYTIFATNRSTSKLFKQGINLNVSINVKDLFLFVALLICTKGLLMLSLKLSPVALEIPDSGIPRNWFPSALTFLGFLFSLYCYFDIRRKRLAPKAVFLCLSLNFLLTSMYYGSNIYASDLLKEAGVLNLIHTVKFSINILIGGFIIYSIKHRLSSLGIVTWLALSCIVLYLGELAHSSQIAYISFSCLLLSCVLIYLDITKSQDKFKLKLNHLNSII